jgi:hypothetical protein
VGAPGAAVVRVQVLDQLRPGGAQRDRPVLRNAEDAGSRLRQ